MTCCSMEEECQFFGIHLGAGAVGMLHWLFGNWDAPELVGGSVACDDGLFFVGDVDV